MGEVGGYAFGDPFEFGLWEALTRVVFVGLMGYTVVQVQVLVVMG